MLQTTLSTHQVAALIYLKQEKIGDQGMSPAGQIADDFTLVPPQVACPIKPSAFIPPLSTASKDHCHRACQSLQER